VLVAVLLAIQPVGHLALADEPAPGRYRVVGAAAVTLRAEPDGSSVALTIVPAESVVTVVGPDAVTREIVWRNVRTAEGTVGYVPAGFLTPVGGGAVTGDSPASQIASRPSGAAPSQSVGAAPAPPVEAAPDQSAPGAQTSSANAAGTGSTASTSARQPTPSPTPTAPAPTGYTTVERRRGQEMTIGHFAQAPAPDGRKMAAGRIVVGFRSGASQQGQAAAHSAAGATSTRSTNLPDMMVVQVDQGSVQQALVAYRGRSDVAWAQPSYVYRATLTPNDPLLGSQWGLLKIGAPIAWDVTTGQASTRVAVVDSGIYAEESLFPAPDGLPGHPDLRGKVEHKANFTTTSPSTDDFYGHGTLMSGIIAARTNSAAPQGVAGVGFNVRLMNAKVLGDDGFGAEEWVIDGITWAADNGARVINLSIGSEGPCSPALQAAVDYAWARNAVLIAAAGNGGADGTPDPASESPGNCAHVMSIAAIDHSDALASFSNFGPSIPLTAPGVDVLSTNNAGTYSGVTGTSPSTAHVSGVAALLVSTPHGTSNQSIFTRLLQTADPIVGTGTSWGSGRVNAAAAVGPASCSPRPPVGISTGVNGSGLNATTFTTGVGNAVRFIQAGAVAGTTLNALVSFPTPASESAGTKTYVPRTVGATAGFQMQRQTPASPSTLPFVVTDGCGTWKSFVGGGTAAGF
jgi:thermitase